MHPTELFQELKSHYGVESDSEIAALLGLTSGRISQLRSRPGMLTAKQIVSFVQRASAIERQVAFEGCIRPVVEMYPLDISRSKQDKKWELLATGKGHPRSQQIRNYLESIPGIYLFYDSQGCAIYAGKTEKQNLWKEMTNAYNRERSNHHAVFVKHPTTGATFSPAWKSLRQPKKTQVCLYETALYFSAYEVTPELIPKLEAFMVRAFCNSLSNKKMETF